MKVYKKEDPTWDMIRKDGETNIEHSGVVLFRVALWTAEGQSLFMIRLHDFYNKGYYVTFFRTSAQVLLEMGLKSTTGRNIHIYDIEIPSKDKADIEFVELSLETMIMEYQGLEEKEEDD